MTVHKLSCGDGYTYLTRQVASADRRPTPGQAMAAYYTETGNPPGEWMGAGARDLGVGGVVSEAQMRALFGRGMHPDADRIVADLQASGVPLEEADRLARLGRRYPSYTARLGADGRARPVRHAVAGYDLVFTPVKSVSLLWALGDGRVLRAVEAAHHDAVADTIGWLERNALFARVGNVGEYQVDTHGLIATGFDHRESRLGDPDLHTHVAIANKVRAIVPGDEPGRERWLAIDGRTLYAAAMAASERYNSRLEATVADRLGAQFVARGDTVRRDQRPVREVAGVPVGLIKAFSRRRGEIETRYHQLLRDYRDKHLHEPDRAVQIRLAQQATLETREAKPEGRSFGDLLGEWRRRAATLLGGDAAVDDLVKHAVGQNVAVQAVDSVDVDAIARSVLAVLEQERSTWSRWNLLAEVERQTRPLRLPSPADRDGLVERVRARATAPDRALRITTTQLTLDDPDVVRLDGTPAALPHAVERYTTRTVLDAEQDLLAAAREPTTLTIGEPQARAVVAEVEHREGWTLDAGQRELAVRFTTDDRRLLVGIGPAGAGKTTALRAALAVWQANGRRVVPLATSAKATEVLAADLGRRAENLHKFLHETHRPRRAHETDDPFFSIRAGDVLLVDEAGMAGTLRLHQLTRLAQAAGAQVRLVGDPWQLGAVESGGALRLLVHDIGAVELTTLHRFTNPAEAKATLQLRAGDPAAIEFYQRHDRIRDGSREAMLDAAYTAWRTDLDHGLNTVMVAASNEDATALNLRARLDRVAAGEVAPQWGGVARREHRRGGGLGHHPPQPPRGVRWSTGLRQERRPLAHRPPSVPTGRSPCGTSSTAAGPDCPGHTRNAMWSWPMPPPRTASKAKPSTPRTSWLSRTPPAKPSTSPPAEPGTGPRLYVQTEALIDVDLERADPEPVPARAVLTLCSYEPDRPTPWTLT